MRTQQLIGQKAAQQPSFTPVLTGLLQHQYACGQHTGGGKCEGCRQKREGMIQRAPVGAATVNGVPPIVYEVLNSPGQPLNVGTRAFIEPRFGHDFSGVKVHNTIPAMMQAKLRVSQPGDKYEQEADQVAEQVMRMPSPESVQRAGFSSYPQHIHIQRMQPQPEEVRRQLETESERKEDNELTEEENLQTKEFPGQTPTVNPDMHTQIHSFSGRGQPLSVSDRAFMEQRFGYDFSQVRIHTDTQAAESARAVNARAYTMGRDVVFGAGQYAPETNEGKRLLAHELTHVLQQAGLRNSHRDRVINTSSTQTETNLNRPTTLLVTGATDECILQRRKMEDLIPLIPGHKCLMSLISPTHTRTFNEFLPWYYEWQHKIYNEYRPVPNKIWDAFGHCWMGCEGTRRCGSIKTFIGGTAYELAREAGWKGEHDSFRQDMYNRAIGSALGKKSKSNCYDACRLLATLKSGGLDLSAPPNTLWTPQRGEYADPLKKATAGPEHHDVGVPAGVPVTEKEII